MDQQRKNIPNNNLQYYLNHPFKLHDLQSLVPPSQPFIHQNPLIELNPSSNFTFETVEYSFHLIHTPENQLRLFYYALLTTIYQTTNLQLKNKIQSTLLNIVFQNLNIILPVKQITKNYNKNSHTIMTTNQIKSSFAKFHQILNSSTLKSKTVLTQIINLPQIDFVLMSVFQMYFAKNYETLSLKLQKIHKDFDLKTQILPYGFKMGDFQFQIKYHNQDNYQTVIVRKVSSQKKITKSLNLERKETTESIGEVQQQDLYKSQEEVNQGLNKQQLINARFVQSHSSGNFFHPQKQVISQQVIDFIRMNETPKILISLKDHHQSENIQPQNVIKVSQKLKKTSFIKQNKNTFSFLNLPSIQRNKERKNSAPLDLLNNFNNIKSNIRPWSPKSFNTEKVLNFQRSLQSDIIQKASKRTLSTESSTRFFKFAKIELNSSQSFKRLSSRNNSQKPMFWKDASKRNLVSSLAASS